MSDAFSNLAHAFSDPDRNCRQTVYVYRIAPSGKVVRPYLAKITGYFDDDGDLLSFLRDEHFGGDFRVLIRDGSRMVFGGDISVWRSPRARSAFT